LFVKLRPDKGNFWNQLLRFNYVDALYSGVNTLFVVYEKYESFILFFNNETSVCILLAIRVSNVD